MALGPDGESLEAQIDPYEADFLAAYHQGITAKLGLGAWREGDEALVNDWWGLLHNQAADFTLSFRHLGGVAESPDAFLELFSDRVAARAWLDQYQTRLQGDL